MRVVRQVGCGKFVPHSACSPYRGASDSRMRERAGGVREPRATGLYDRVRSVFVHVPPLRDSCMREPTGLSTRSTKPAALVTLVPPKLIRDPIIDVENRCQKSSQSLLTVDWSRSARRAVRIFPATRNAASFIFTSSKKESIQSFPKTKKESYFSNKHRQHSR